MSSSTLTRTGAFGLVLLMATACIRVGGDVEVGGDDTISGTLDVALDAAAFEAFTDFDAGSDEFDEGDDPSDELDAAEIAREVDELNHALDIGSITAETIDDEGWLGLRWRFDDATFEELDELFAILEDEQEEVPVSLSLERTGGEHVLTGVIEDLGADDPFGIVDVDTEVAVAFAGQVTETNGDLDEETDTVTWEDSGPMEVVADAGDGFGWLLGIVVAIAAIGLIALGLVIGKRRGQPSDAPAERTMSASGAPGD